MYGDPSTKPTGQGQDKAIIRIEGLLRPGVGTGLETDQYGHWTHPGGEGSRNAGRGDLPVVTSGDSFTLGIFIHAAPYDNLKNVACMYVCIKRYMKTVLKNWMAFDIHYIVHTQKWKEIMYNWKLTISCHGNNRFGVKTLAEPVLIYGQLDHQEQTSGKLTSKIQKFCLENALSANYLPFCQGPTNIFFKQLAFKTQSFESQGIEVRRSTWYRGSDRTILISLLYLFIYWVYWCLVYRWVSKERCNSIANALGLRLSCTNPYIYIHIYIWIITH